MIMFLCVVSYAACPRDDKHAVPALRQSALSGLPEDGTLREEGQVDGVLGSRVDAPGLGALRGAAEEQEGGRRQGQA